MDTGRMQSSLSFPVHGRKGFNFQQKTTNATWYYSQGRGKSLFSLVFSTKPYNSPASSSSSVQLALRSPHFQSKPLPQSETSWTRSTALVTRTEVNGSLASRFPALHCGISSNSYNTSGSRTFRDGVELVSGALSTAFPIWVALGCLLGLIRPSSYSWVQPKWTVLGITLTMLGMGMTLTLDDLRGALGMPKQLFTGFVLQYLVMPLSGFLVSKLLNLPSYYAAGLILVGCCPGGTASNIVTYIARGNVALSVLMTAASTLTAVIMTPFLTAKLAGQYVAVDAKGLLLSTLQVVLLPVIAGAFMNQYSQGLVKFVSPLMPPIAVVTVAILCGNAIAKSASAILMSGQQVVLAASLLHASGFFFGYILSRMLGVDVASSRTISIEVGMQGDKKGDRQSSCCTEVTLGNSVKRLCKVARSSACACKSSSRVVCAWCVKEVHASFWLREEDSQSWSHGL